MFHFHRFSVNSFNEFISQNDRNKTLWDNRNRLRGGKEDVLMEKTSSINTAVGKTRASNAVEVAENIIAVEEQKIHLANTESAKSFSDNNLNKMNH